MIKVSVFTMTYNHEKFVAQAIEGVLAQKCNFLIEMIIADDCSTDNTAQIIEAYAVRYPDIIKPIYHKKNIGAASNNQVCMAACAGEYLAALEGDDYWTDPLKLQLQVEALQEKPDCSMCFHDAETFNDVDGIDVKVEWTFSDMFSHILPKTGSPSRLYSQLDIAKYGWFIPTASMLFRATSLPLPLPDWFEGIYSGDYTLQLLSTKHGPAIYLPRVMSRYRLHQQSVGVTMAHSVSKFERRIYEAKMYQQHVFEPKNKKHADIYLSVQYRGYAKYLGGQGQTWQQLRYLAKGLFYHRQRVPLYLERRLNQLLAYLK